MKPFTKYLLVLFLFTFISPTIASDTKNSPPPEIVAPTPGMVTMVDLGATKCIPCKMMAPILKELQKEYEGRASIIFIDVWQNKDQGKKFGIRAIPTQIFYDANGEEIQRHVGYMDKKSIVAVLTELGVKSEAPKNAE